MMTENILCCIHFYKWQVAKQKECIKIQGTLESASFCPPAGHALSKVILTLFFQ